MSILDHAEKCSFVSCQRPRRGLQDLCDAHLQQRRAGRELGPIRARLRKGQAPVECAYFDCNRKHFAQGWCRSHWQQRRDGVEMRSIRTKAARPRRKERVIPPSGRGFYDGAGYVRVSGYPDHPNAFPSSGKVAEHVLVMSEEIGRGLIDAETVHHKNGQRDDNRLSNLELWSSAQPAGQRVEDKVSFAKEILALYEPSALT